jgi:membrane peptidoglycan carboxypeptidase
MGTNVYGIGETGHYYFQKTPAELNLNECLYLAQLSQVQKKKFMYQFNDQN